MKTEKSILLAFLLNLTFAVIEMLGGLVTGSVAILSDALHDAGDAVSIGISYLLERKSKRRPDSTHTYGYARFSALGSVITSLILLGGSAAIVLNAIPRILDPAEIRYDGVILFAVLGTLLNLVAALLTRRGDSLGERAINLHMLEDVLGWVAVLVGGVVMKLTGLAILDPILSIGVALFILIGAARNLCEVSDLFLEKTPRGVDVDEIAARLCEIPGVLGVHHIHIRSIDGYHHSATMHIVAEGDSHTVKELVRAELGKHGIVHVTLELEGEGEECHGERCAAEPMTTHRHHHHHR
jgi:cobalt-zinc-cadmium efflux system protein